MELGDWAAIAEIIGAIAIVVTLIYLAVQIKQANKQLAVIGRQARAAHTSGVLEPIISSPDLASIFDKLDFVDFGEFGLSKEDSAKFGAWCHIWMQAEQSNYYLLETDANDGQRSWWLSTPVGAEFWEKNKGFYDQEFVAHMEALKASLQSDSRSPQDIAAGAQKS